MNKRKVVLVFHSLLRGLKIYATRKTILGIMLLLVAMAGKAQVANTTQLVGSWNGKLSVGGMSLTIVLNIEQADGYVVVTMDSPDQGAKGLSTDKEFLSDDSVAVKMDYLDASYRARLKDGKLDGTFTQRGISFPLVLSRGKYEKEIRRPQTPQQPFPYETEAVTFRNEKDGATLAGTITYPVGYDKTAKRKPVVVLLVSGSGLQNRDEELMGHKPFIVIADYLASHGIATLRYDDRTYGESVGGDAEKATTMDFMSDAAAGMDYLRSLKQFRKVGCLGHSEGGAVTFLLASRKKADFIVSMAGPGVKGDTLLTAQANRIMELSGVPGTMTTEQYRNGDALKKLPRGPYGLIWMQWFLEYDPSADIRKTRCPAMVINGSLDSQVIASLNLPAIRRLLPSSKKNLIKEYPSLNHLFQHCTTGNPTEYPTIEETISSEVLNDMVEWIGKLF